MKFEEGHRHYDGRVPVCPVCGNTVPTDRQWVEKSRHWEPRCENGHPRRAMNYLFLPEAINMAIRLQIKAKLEE